MEKTGEGTPDAVDTPGAVAGNHGMSRIQQERAEILRLVARLRESQRSDSGSGGVRRRSLFGSSRAPEPSRAAPPDERLSLRQRQHQLAELKQLRQSLEARGPGTSVVSVLQGLEQRLARIEQNLGSDVGKPALPAAEASSDYTFSGVVQGELLSDMLQLVSSNALAGIFVVEDASGKYTLYFDDGQIFHAEGPNATGESAFFGAFAVTSGRYNFRETDELPKERTITGNTQFLILEALRQIDESRAGN